MNNCACRFQSQSLFTKAIFDLKLGLTGSLTTLIKSSEELTWIACPS